MAASVCRKSLMRMVLPRLTWPRSRALMMPCVTVWFSPNGLPMASTHWPTRARSLSPRVAVGRSVAPSSAQEGHVGLGVGPAPARAEEPAVGQVDA